MHQPAKEGSSLRVAVLLGGTSAEREVSLRSGASVASALAQAGHRVTEIDPANQPLEQVEWRNFDVAFLALHGTFGEDGAAQLILENLGVAYTGSGPEASRLAFSKSAAKERFAHHGVPTAPYLLIHASDNGERIARQAESIGYPLVVKPDAQGSSIGVSIVREPSELPAALRHCFHYDQFGLMETFIDGTEWTVGFIDDLALPPIRIGTARKFFDYYAKYQDDDTVYEFDHNASDELIGRIVDASKRACQAVGTHGLARVDLMVDRSDRPWVLEINTIPGMTDHSLVPKAAARMGLSLPQLCDRLVRSCQHGQKVQT